jgi:hypothetical protein
MDLVNDKSHQNFNKLLVKISKNLKVLSQIFKLRQNINELNVLFEESLKTCANSRI